ncbi:MAG: pyrroloquinoline quinone-dependent dehydrogenase [Acidimicrobiia bacterium]|nr:pyrroloquinoline quinone-dependent dehydrogenase [Acidimicrobiia bacterium]
MSRIRSLATVGGTIAAVALVGSVLAIRTGAQSSSAAGEWRYYSADPGASKYSALDAINAGNVTRLKVAWRHLALDPELRTSVRGLTAGNYYRVTPLMVGGRLYVQNSVGLVEALDPATGRAIWTQKPLEPGLAGLTGATVARGVAYWRGGDDERIFTVRKNLLFALNAKTGDPVPTFAKQGQFDLQLGVGPDAAYNWGGSPLVVNDVLVIGSNLGDFPNKKTGTPGDVRAYDARTGRLLWTFHVIPHAGEFGHDTWGGDSAEYTGATNMWTSPSADPELGYVYIPLSSPTNDWYGGHRLGNNLFSDSLVCLDAKTGKRVWHFQTVHHDLWDYDLPASPILADITVDGRRIKAVVQLTKQGFAFAFDRATGQPVWPIEERPVPQSTVPGEQASRTQPFPTRPPAFAKQGIAVDDLIDFTPQLRAEAKAIADQYVYGSMFTPPPVLGADGKKGLLQMPGWVGGADWNGGAFDHETGALYVPSINAPIISVVSAPDPKVSDFRYMNPLGIKERVVEGPQGLPLLKPPYGTIVKIDLNKGVIDWTVPNGDGPRNHPALRALNLPPMGQPGRAAPLLTKALLFIGEGDPAAAVNPPGGGGNIFRAYDKATGAVLWSMDLGAGTTGAPMTYLFKGRQYVVVAVGSTNHPAELVALTLE